MSLSYWVSTIKCLSKHQGSDLRILSTSTILSKEKRIRWLPRFFILKPVFALHSGVKVLAMASMLRGHLVRNLVAMANSDKLALFFRRSPYPSFSERESEFQCFVMSSIGVVTEFEAILCVSQTPEKKDPLALR